MFSVLLSDPEIFDTPNRAEHVERAMPCFVTVGQTEIIYCKVLRVLEISEQDL